MLRDAYDAMRVPQDSTANGREQLTSKLPVADACSWLTSRVHTCTSNLEDLKPYKQPAKTMRALDHKFIAEMGWCPDLFLPEFWVKLQRP